MRDDEAARCEALGDIVAREVGECVDRCALLEAGTGDHLDDVHDGIDIFDPSSLRPPL